MCTEYEESCKVCFRRFKSTRIYERHFSLCFQSHSITRSTSDDSLNNMCIHCGIICEDAIVLGMHFASQHLSTHENVHCYICGKKQLNQLEMKSHLEMHDFLRKYNLTCSLVYCSECEDSFKTKTQLRKHLQDAHNRSNERNIGFLECRENVINYEKNLAFTETDISSDSGLSTSTAEDLSSVYVVEEVCGEDNTVMNNAKNGSPEIESLQCRSPDRGVSIRDDISTAEDSSVINVVEEVHRSTLWKCALCPNFSCKYGLKQRSHNIKMHKDLFKTFCRFCGRLYNSRGRLRAHEGRCPFHLSLKRDPSGFQYVTMWRRTATDPNQREKMSEECHSSIIDNFLLSNKSKQFLLDYVPIPSQNYRK